MTDSKPHSGASAAGGLGSLLLFLVIAWGWVSNSSCYKNHQADSVIAEKANEALQKLSSVGNEDTDVGIALASFNKEYADRKSDLSYIYKNKGEEADFAVSRYSKYLMDSLLARDAGHELAAKELERGRDLFASARYRLDELVSAMR